MKTHFLLFLLAFGFSLSLVAEEKPNIIYILLDDAGYADLSCYGQKKFSTPNMDRLASEGIKFTDHYSGSTVCAPTRCSLLTGLHTGRAFVRGNREVQPEGQSPMPADIVTLPRLLGEAGYTTGAFGKWGLGAPGSVSDPMEHFDAFYGYNCQRQAHDYYPTHLWKNRERVELNKEVYTHDLIMDEALGFVKENKDDPFFIYLAVAIPHAAMQVPESYAAPWREKFPQFEEKIGRYAGTEVNNPIATFAGMMTLLDDGVGELLALLDELEIDENTIVMLSSDNGPHQEGGHEPDFFDSNGPLRGYKRDLTEGGIRTHMLARWPGKIAPGTVTDHVSAHWDILPTAMDLAGADTPSDLSGISFLPTLLGQEDQDEHDYLYWEFYERGGKKAARWGDWKAVQLNVNTSLDSPIEIYDLSNDIGEENNLAESHPELVERAKEIFAEAHVPSPNWEFTNKKAQKKTVSPESVMRGVVRHYADLVHQNYKDSLTAAEALEEVLKRFVENPTKATFEAAKQEWIISRQPYLQTEAFRFYAGPIDDDDGPEPMINGWPMDEYHIDYIEGAPTGGLINTPESYPDITKELIASLNEKAGETAITSGFHAIEFLLWGQDWNDDGPGDRPYTDYTTAENADRRGTYLLACADLLTDHLTHLAEEWAPGDSENYRTEFLSATPPKSIRSILYGLHALSGKELAGERLLVAWDTQDQEDEHSCFSDTTHQDAYYDAIGIENVYRGRYRPLDGEPLVGTGVRALVRTFFPDEVNAFDAKMVEIVKRVKAIPQPFDQAIIGDDDSPARQAILEAVTSLEDFAAMMNRIDRAVLEASEG